MLRNFTCIICPNGCEITANIENGQILQLDGALCPRGNQYVTQELTAPQRTIASSVRVMGGDLPLVSVRLTHAIPKDRIFDMMAEIRNITLTAPVQSGQILLEKPLGLDTTLIATKNVAAV